MVRENASRAGELVAEPVDLTEEFFRNPHAVYGRLRGRGAVHFVRFPDASTGWLITGYEAAKQVFADPSISKDLGSAGAREAVANGSSRYVDNSVFVDMMVFHDPPEHTRLRALVNRAFGSRAVRDMEVRVTEVADTLLANLAGRAGEVQDLLEGYAFPLGMLLICELLGVPHEDRDRFWDWSRILMSGNETRDTRSASVQEFADYIDKLVRTKSAAPGQDVLSELIAAREGGDRLTHQELISMVFVLLVAGFETTVNLIGNAVAKLLTDKDSRQLLCDDPDRMAAFVEEVLRYRSPTRETTFRYTTTPVTVAGTDIPAGQIIVVSVAAANRDPHRFTDADHFDLTRPDNQHIAFGHGIHHCVGAPLARMEGAVALARLLAEYPDLELDESVRLEWRKSLVIRGFTTVPVRLRP
ncbi:cytochrome P450 [Nocardia sp. NEAU-G5]|uniref:Cytochrome P450 n=1 Tax=Nocardia albiluteola TaxID=2842303 RepID=A0ABS6BAS8_9NOCA|nr:cytochrome P450 [Nocardia albiluteola]MBU3067407.1 cytochrome P450 [Nocardia albiluteola]